MFYSYFYLVYNIIGYSDLWIVDESKDLKILTERTKDFFSEEEKYKIYRIKYTRQEIELINKNKFIRFRKLFVNNNYKLYLDTSN